jgi:hypothetical protein
VVVAPGDRVQAIVDGQSVDAVEEVHACVPSGGGRYAVDSLRTPRSLQLPPHCEHRLSLSATCGLPANLRAARSVTAHTAAVERCARTGATGRRHRN